MTAYHFTNNANLTAANRTATTIIKAFFGSTLSSAPVFRVIGSVPNRVIVHLFYYVSPSKSNVALTNKALATLGDVLSRLYSDDVVLELQFVQLHQPYLNSSILAQYLAMNASKYGFNRMQNTLMNIVPFVNTASGTTNNTTQLPAHISGIKIQLSGLLTTQRAAPRKTVYTASAGTFHGANTTVDYASSTSKSAVGAYTIKV